MIFKQHEIKDLIDEVSKVKPDQIKVKNLVRKLDIPFSKDPIEQMTLVLKKMDIAGLGSNSRNLHLQEELPEHLSEPFLEQSLEQLEREK